MPQRCHRPCWEVATPLSASQHFARQGSPGRRPAPHSLPSHLHLHSHTMCGSPTTCSVTYMTNVRTLSGLKQHTVTIPFSVAQESGCLLGSQEAAGKASVGLGSHLEIRLGKEALLSSSGCRQDCRPAVPGHVGFPGWLPHTERTPGSGESLGSSFDASIIRIHMWGILTQKCFQKSKNKLIRGPFPPSLTCICVQFLCISIVITE